MRGHASDFHVHGVTYGIMHACLPFMLKCALIGMLLQAEMACLLLHFISEDLTVFELQNGAGS